jgi:hypothetical protein
VEDPSVAAIRIFPNPARDIIGIELQGHNFYSAGLYSSEGMLIRETVISGQHVIIPVGEISSGLYHLRLTGQDKVVMRKVVILKQ